MGNTLEKSQNEQDAYEEMINVKPVQEISKLFIKDFLIVWHDPNVNSEENQKYQKPLKSIADLQVFQDWKEAADFVKSTKRTCHVITSGTNGENFVKEIHSLEHVSSVYVFCGNINFHKQWIEKYKIKEYYVENEITRLLDQIKAFLERWQRQNSALRVDFPSFVPIFDDIQKSDASYLHLYLKSFVKLQNREQSKREFLALAKAIYPDYENMAKFEKSYNQYSMKNIINWYTKESFLYKVTNNCLRIATADSILYCRLILKDLEEAIKMRYNEKSRHFSGLLYRGAYISDAEWDTLTQNIGKEIEMHGFLSTSKNRTVALNFAISDLKKKAFITILVPGNPGKEEQGFAEVSEFSDFSTEEEILFNVRSRFTILEAQVDKEEGEGFRHLVLFYGSQAIKKAMFLANPTIPLKIKNIELLKCHMCAVQAFSGKQEKTPKSPHDKVLFYLNLETSQYLCQACITIPKVISSQHAYCILPINEKFKNYFQEGSAKMVFPGILLTYPSETELPFYGYRCSRCQTNKFKYCLKCLVCKPSPQKKILCPDCFNQESYSSCLEQGHILIQENRPFVFWTETMSTQDLNHLDYQEYLSNSMQDFQIAKTLYNTHNYDKAAECLEKIIKEMNNKKTGKVKHHEKKAKAYNCLGLIYEKMLKYQEALDCHLKALKTRKTIFGENHIETANSLNNLGLIYQKLKKYDDSLSCHQKSLEIKKALFGDYHQWTARSLNNLGSVYGKIEDYKSALECYLLALHSYKATYGNKHPATANSLNNVGLVYGYLNYHDLALEYHLLAFDIYKSLHGDKHPDTANSYNNIGWTYLNLNKYKEAIEFYSKALATFEVLLGNNHPKTQLARKNFEIAKQKMELKNFQFV